MLLQNSSITREYSFNSRIGSDQGVTTLEFSLIAVIFFALVLTLFDMSLYLTTRSVMNSAANKAISVASVIDDLDTECSLLPAGKQAACGTDRLTAIRTVINTARNNSLGTLVRGQAGNILADLLAGNGATPAIEFQIVKNSALTTTHRAYKVDGQSATATVFFPTGTWVNPGVSLRDVLQSQPMEIWIRGTYRSLSPWLPAMTVVGHAVGYREPRFISSYPEYVDCRGQSVPVGTVPSTIGYCPCSSDPGNGTVVEGPNGSCTCRSSLVQSGTGNSITCSCNNPNQTPDPVTGTCACPTLNCANNEIINNTTCQCDPCPGFYQSNPNHTACGRTCPAAVLAAGGANCGGDDYWDPSTCSCKSCPQYQDANGAHSACACVLNVASDCGAGQIADTANCQCLSCGANTTPNAGQSACTCNLAATSCPPGTFLNQTATNCSCTACGSGQQPNAGQTACVACTLTAADCTGNTSLDPQACACTPCTGNFTPNGSHSACTCQLNPLSCAANQYLDTATCQCRNCSAGQTPNGAQTSCSCIAQPSSCAGNQTFNTSTCSCNNCAGSGTANGAHTTCSCSLRASDCGTSQYVNPNPNTCACINCPTGQVQNGAGTGCQCPAEAAAACQGGTLNSSCGCQCPAGESYYPGGGCAPSICCPLSGAQPAGCRPCNWGSNGGTIIEGF